MSSTLGPRRGGRSARRRRDRRGAVAVRSPRFRASRRISTFAARVPGAAAAGAEGCQHVKYPGAAAGRPQCAPSPRSAVRTSDVWPTFLHQLSGCKRTESRPAMRAPREISAQYAPSGPPEHVYVEIRGVAGGARRPWRFWRAVSPGQEPLLGRLARRLTMASRSNLSGPLFPPANLAASLFLPWGEPRGGWAGARCGDARAGTFFWKSPSRSLHNSASVCARCTQSTTVS